MPLMSYREYARQKNVSLKTIQDRITKGTITENAIARPKTDFNGGVHPKIDSEIADADFAKLGNPIKKVTGDNTPASLMSERKQSGPQPIKAKVTHEEIDGKKVRVEKEPYRGSSEGERLLTARASKEELQSRKIYLEVCELEGRLRDVREIREALETKILEVRTALFNMADKAALQVLGKKDLLEVKQILKKSMNDALSGLTALPEDFQVSDDDF